MRAPILKPGEYCCRCHQCGGLMIKRWDDCSPGPDLCGQDCYDELCEAEARRVPAWCGDD